VPQEIGCRAQSCRQSHSHWLLVMRRPRPSHGQPRQCHATVYAMGCQGMSWPWHGLPRQCHAKCCRGMPRLSHGPSQCQGYAMAMPWAANNWIVKVHFLRKFWRIWDGAFGIMCTKMNHCTSQHH
jgi:hypothetical protein